MLEYSFCFYLDTTLIKSTTITFNIAVKIWEPSSRDNTETNYGQLCLFIHLIKSRICKKV